MTATTMPYRLTTKQKQVLMTIIKGSPDGDDIDLDQLLESIPYETTKASMQFTIRALVNRGFIEKLPPVVRRERKRVLYSATMKGRLILFGDVVVEDADLGELSESLSIAGS